jgi:hypothetical protein
MLKTPPKPHENAAKRKPAEPSKEPLRLANKDRFATSLKSCFLRETQIPIEGANEPVTISFVEKLLCGAGVDTRHPA